MAPATYGDIRLRMGSPAINAGDDAATSELTDLSGRDRKNGTIDLGAYEHHAYVVDIAADEVSDPGTGTSLREAIALANADPLPSQIEFDPTVFDTFQTITLDHGTHGLLTLSASCAMVGPGSGLLTVDANGGIRPLTVDDGDTVTFQNVVITGLRLTGGNANGVAFTDDTRGGGLFCQEHLQLHDVTIENNSANGFGGGLALSTGADAWIQRCQILSNVAGGSGGGGGMRLNANSSVHIVDTIFRGNHATGNQTVSGGGAILTKAGLELTLMNCLFQGNRSNSRGGALRLENDAKLVNCSLQGNATAVDGGAIYVNSAAPTLQNCIVWNNSEGGMSNTTSASIFNSTSTTSIEYCLIANSGGSAAWDAAIGTDGGNNLDTDPFFILEGNPNDATFVSGDLRLRCDSPAIDAGKNNANTYTHDLVGNPRIVDGNADTTATIDLGAYEVPLAAQVTATADAGSGSLRETLVTTAPGGSLTFDASLSGQTIILTSGELLLNKDITIDGSSLTDGLTLSGNSSSRILKISLGTTVVLDSLTFIDGVSALNAGAIITRGNTTIRRCAFTNNTAATNGGAISNDSGGDLLVENCYL